MHYKNSNYTCTTLGDVFTGALQHDVCRVTSILVITIVCKFRGLFWSDLLGSAYSIYSWAKALPISFNFWNG